MSIQLSNKYFRFNSPFMSIVIVENIKHVKKRAKLDPRNLSFCQFDFQKINVLLPNKKQRRVYGVDGNFMLHCQQRGRLHTDYC